MEPSKHHSTQERHRAIDDGLIFDFTETAMKLGLNFEFVVTRAAYERCIRVPDGVTGHDETTRATAVLSQYLRTMKNENPTTTEPLLFEAILPIRSPLFSSFPFPLKGRFGYGEGCRLILTVMLPEEN